MTHAYVNYGTVVTKLYSYRHSCDFDYDLISNDWLITFEIMTFFKVFI